MTGKARKRGNAKSRQPRKAPRKRRAGPTRAKVGHFRRPGHYPSPDSDPQVIYVHPAKQRVGFSFSRHNVAPFPVLPAGLAGLVNILRAEGIAVRGLNYPLERLIDPAFDLRAWLREVGHPRLALVDLHWYEHSFGALDVARVCKQVLPATRVVLGGMTASLYAREILETCPDVDFVIRGDADEPLRQLVLGICQGYGRVFDLDSVPNLTYRSGDQVIENGLEYWATSSELTSLDFTRLDFLDHAREYLAMLFMGSVRDYSPLRAQTLGHWLTNGRGCVYNCSFCGGGRDSHRIISGRHRLTMRSPGSVADDLEELHDRGVHQVALTLDPETAGQRHWQELFSRLSRHQARVGLYNEAFQLPSDGFLDAIAECADMRYSAIALSVLSGDEQVRRTHGKLFSNEQLFECLQALKRRQVPLYVYLSFNLPGETRETLRKTMEVVERIGATYPRELLSVYNQPHTIDPCSPMSLEPERFDIDVAYRSFGDYVDYCRHTASERPGVLGIDHRGFIYRGRTREVEREMQRLWLDFAQRQDFACF